MGGRGLNSNPLATSFATRMGAKANGACYARVGTNVDDNRSMGLCGGRMERSSSTFVPVPIRARLSAYEARWGAYLVISEHTSPVSHHADPPFLRTRL